MQPKQLTPTELIAVSVPANSKNPIITNCFIDVKGKNEQQSYLTFEISNYVETAFKDIGCFYQIIGTVTAKEIDFDISLHGKTDEYLHEAIFRQMLIENGLHFTNPIEDINPDDYGSRPPNWVTKAKKEWRAAENNLIEKLVILKKI